MRLGILFIFFLGFVSCKKETSIVLPEPLIGEKLKLVGKWSWAYTYHISNQCDQGSLVYNTIYSTDSLNQYSMELFSTGFAKFYRNNEIISDQGLFFDDFYLSDSDYVFVASLDDNPSTRFVGRVYNGDDSLYTWDFPFIPRDSNCESFRSIFIKE
jgi:hypothetical protein